ncbi:DNA-methyltransferase [Enterobacter asburiae]|uniref:DNA-methyltransferase n=1 Tax=Enterobacter asburiae TaxID=61645 RepID=UPI00210B27C9|nr:site-specific DNA-methyltransferase [Enterobacter asburiae]MCQ4370008.1 site-specific DNA-methyltransferase [Enterobacter asburiae]HDC4620388.1 site-specific DNA-methyltransferase [Enterobacter asburiae]
MMTLINECCLKAMKRLPPASIDLVCADIPYGTTQCKWDSVIDLHAMWENLYRVAKPNAAIVLFSAQPFTSVLVSSNIKHWRSEWIWEKGNATGFLNAKKQPMRAHENIEVFYRKQCTYNPRKTLSKKCVKIRRAGFKSGCYGKAEKLCEYISNERYPRTVQFFSKDASRLHPTQKPVALVKYMIETYSNPGEVVLDFTMGSGTAGVACHQSGRRFVGIEKDPDIFAIACQRLGEAIT